MRKNTYLNNRLRIRVLYQKGLTVSEIASKVKMTHDDVYLIIKDIGLMPKFEHEKVEPHAFAEHCRKRVKI